MASELNTGSNTGDRNRLELNTGNKDGKDVIRVELYTNIENFRDGKYEYRKNRWYLTRMLKTLNLKKKK